LKLDVSSELLKRIDKKHQIPKTLKGVFSAKRGGVFSARRLICSSEKLGGNTLICRFFQMILSKN